MSGLRVLMYHKVSESETDFLTVSEKQLHQQLIWLKKKFTIITLRDLTQALKIGKSLPINPLLITFDDGYLNNYTLAYPIFKQYRIPFSIFLVSSFIGKKVKYDNQEQVFLNETQLIEMQDLVQYGFHGSEHKHLMDLTPEAWNEEIETCKSELSKLNISAEPVWAYTYGGFPKKNKSLFDKLKLAFKNNNIHCAFRIGNRINQLNFKEPYALQRIDIRGNESFLKFKLKVRFGKLF